MPRVNEDDIEWSEQDHGDHQFRRKHLGEAADGEQLGCSLYEIDPGNRSWPYHYHAANEEALFVLSGEATLRGEDGDTSLRAGDYVTIPAGEDGAHQLVNDGEAVFRYLMVSTMEEPDVTIYPEMEKFGVYVGSPPGGREERTFEGYFPLDADVEYWE
jgi:uncharacterized cupin superfamily protein